MLACSQNATQHSYQKDQHLCSHQYESLKSYCGGGDDDDEPSGYETTWAAIQPRDVWKEYVNTDKCLFYKLFNEMYDNVSSDPVCYATVLLKHVYEVACTYCLLQCNTRVL